MCACAHEQENYSITAAVLWDTVKKTRCEMKKDEIGGAYSMHDRLAKTIIFKYENPKERDHLEDLSADRRIILKQI
jgi:hypothetical protein